MKKDQNLPNKIYIVITVQENHFRTTPITQGINHHITQVLEEDHQNEEIHKILHKIFIIDQIVEITIRDQIPMQHNLFLDTVPKSNPRNTHYSNNQSRNSSYNRNRDYSHNRNRSYSNNRNQNYRNNRSRNISYNRSNYHRLNDNYQNRSWNNSQNRNSSYNNQYRNYSSHHIGIITIIIILKHRYRSSTQDIKDILIKCRQMKKQLQTPQVLMTQEVTNYN